MRSWTIGVTVRPREKHTSGGAPAPHRRLTPHPHDAVYLESPAALGKQRDPRSRRGTTMPSDSQSTFGEVLRRYRQAARLSQDELALKTGLSTRALSDLERGINRVPR